MGDPEVCFCFAEKGERNMAENQQFYMRRLNYRLIGGLLLLVVIWALFYDIQFRGNASVAVARRLEQSRMDIRSIEQELETVTAHHNRIGEMIINTHLNDVRLYGEVLIKVLDEEDVIDRLPADFVDENHAYIHIRRNTIQAPESIPADLQLEPAMFSDQTGWFFSGTQDPEQYVVYYYKLTDTTCLIKWLLYETSALRDYKMSGLSEDLNAIQNVTGIMILRFSVSGSGDGCAYFPLHIPERFSAYQTLEDFGITREMIGSAADLGSSRPADDESADFEIPPDAQRLTIEGKPYECFFRMSDGGTILNVFMIPSDNEQNWVAERTALLLGVFAIISFSFLVWAFSVRSLVIRYNLNNEQKKTFFPAMVFRRAAVFILVGVLTLAGSSVFLQCVFENFSLSAKVEKSLQSLQLRLDSNQAWADEYKTMRMNTYGASVKALSMLSLSKRGLIDNELLESACRTTDADYIVIYDETGNEVMSNTGYIGLSLAEGGEEMRDFSRLLKGVPHISKSQVTDAQTGLTRSVFGTSLLRISEDSPNASYWALLLFVDPDRVLSNSYLSPNEIMASIDSGQTTCFSVDPESGRILASSEREFIGKNTDGLGLPQEALRDGYMGYFWLGGTRVYGASAEKDGILYFYTADQQEIFQNVQRNTLRCSAACLCLMTVLAVFMLFGYGKTYERYADSGDLLPEEENRILTGSGRRKLSVDPAFRWLASDLGHGDRHGSRTPAYNALRAGQILYILVVLITAIHVSIRIGRGNVDNSALAYILSGRWTKGFNLFAISNILFLFVEISVGAILIRFLILLLTQYIGTKGETIGRLLLDFVGYVSFILFLYYALSYLGVNTGALVASIGILSFGLTLGAQDLVRDILAGLSIVMDGEFQVGDIIEINGFRGTVLEVGVRTTKIEGRGGNILIVGNRDLKNVINKTRKNSWYAMEINIAETEELSRVEALLREKLPEIGRNIPEIISGPFYKGVIKIGGGKIALSIIAECEEENYYHVQRQLNGTIALLLEKNQISMK